MNNQSDNLENIEGGRSKECLCGRQGRFRFYKANNGFLCLKHLEFWLSCITSGLVNSKRDEDKVLAMIYTDGKH